MKITTIIIAIVMVGWMSGEARADWFFSDKEIAKMDQKPKPSCAEKWAEYRGKIFKVEPLSKFWDILEPDCPRPEPEYSGADYTLTSTPTIAKGTLDRKYKLKPKPECRWEWKSTLDLAGSSEWEPFSILESDEIEWGPKYGDSRTFSQRGITVKKTRIYLKRQVCEEAK